MMKSKAERKIRNKFRDIKEDLDGKLFTLKQFNGATKKEEINIPDPYKTGLENYNRILKIVEKNVEILVRNIVEINNHELLLISQFYASHAPYLSDFQFLIDL